VSQKLHPAFGYNEEQRNKVLETEANRFLTQYWPEALHTVSSVPLRQIAEEKMGLHRNHRSQAPDGVVRH
jgi:hypothetical protein